MSTQTDTTPAELAEPDEYGTPPLVDLPPAQDTKPGRPTTRAGRAAARQARKVAGAADTKKPATKPAPRKAALDKRLTNALVGVGGMVAGTAAITGSAALQADGLVIIEHSANVAEAISRLADEDPRIKAALERLLSAGAWSGVVAAVLPIVLGIGANHGVIPPQLLAVFAMTAAPAPEPAAA